MSTKILLIEDNPGDARLVREALAQREAGQFDFEHTGRLSDGLRRLETPDIDLVLLDMGLPDSQGLDTLTVLRKRMPRMPVIVLTGSIDAVLAAKTVQAGAQDYLVKGRMDGDALGRSIHHAIERKQTEEQQQLAVRILDCLNHNTRTDLLIREILLLVKGHLGVAAAGIRLREGEDYPYFESNGFSPDFLEKERFLCLRDAAGNPVRDSQGKAYLECLCGNILSSRTDPSLPFFTTGGSFWTNSTTDLLASTTDKERQTRIRNRCNKDGYESVALIPLRSGAEIIGLLQFNDRRRGRFTPEMIRFFEGLGASIGIALTRKQTEETIQENEHKLKEAQRLGRIGHWEFDLETRQIRWSDMVYTIYERDPKLGPPTQEEEAAYYPTEDAERLRQCAQSAIETGEPYDIDVRVKLSRGRLSDVVAIGTPVKDARGRVVRLVGTSQDITRRKRAEEALLVSEERYRTLFDGSNDGIALADATTGTIIDCNQTLCCMVERDKAEIRGQSQSILHPPQPLVDGQSPTFRQHRAGHTDQSLEDILLSKSGKLIPVEIRTARVTIGGGPFILGIFRDITERNRAMAEQATLQAQLDQAQKMESVGRLAGGVAHDFNNLLTVILGYAETLQRALKEGDPHRKPVEEIRLAAKRAAGLTRQLLAFSRRQILEPRVLDLGDVVRNLEPMLRRLIGEDIDLRITLPEGLGRIKADPGQIEQVLMNLAVNARDAIENGGKLTIEAANTDLDEDYAGRRPEVKPGPYVMLAVTDTGVGMPPEVQQRLFEPFFTTKEQGKGTGLGLSTVFGIVKQSGGHIAVYSEVGHGTTFKIHLPRVEEAAEPITHARMPAVLPRGTETILVAEDEEGVRELVRMVLLDGGYTVIEAANGEQALHLCERHAGPLHLLISDVIMPQMGGRLLAEHLRKLRPNLKILFTSGYTNDAIAHQGVLDPGVAFLQKPYNLNDLLAKVREVLDQGPWIKP